MFLALGLMQYSIEKRHPRFVIILEYFIIFLMLFITIQISVNKSIAEPKKPDILNSRGVST
jgi:hypothetical protein